MMMKVLSSHPSKSRYHNRTPSSTMTKTTVQTRVGARLDRDVASRLATAEPPIRSEPAAIAAATAIARR